MAQYTPNSWANGDTLTKAKLDRLEAGVAAAIPKADADQIYAAAGSGGGSVFVVAPAPTGTDDTAALQALFDGLPAAGGTVVLRAGTYKLPAGGLATSKPVHLMGVGGHTWEAGGSRIEVPSATATAITFSGAGWRMTDVALVNTNLAVNSVRPTAGAGLLATDADWSRVTRCLVAGFWNNFQYDSGYYYTITDTACLNQQNYGMWLRNTAAGQFDHSDQSIMGCTITKYGDTLGEGGTAVRWESGGGLRFVNNKINGGTQPGYSTTGKFSYGLNCAVADGGSTSVLTVAGNSIENCVQAMIKVEHGGASGTGSFSKMAITGNEIALGGTAISLDGKTVGLIKTAIIAGNAIDGCGGPGVFLRNVSNVHVGANAWGEMTSSCVAVYAGCTSIHVDPIMIAQDNVVLVQDNTVTDANSHGPWGQSHHEIDRGIPLTTSDTTYSPLATFDIPNYAAGIIDFKMTVNVVGVGSGVVAGRRSFTRGNGGAVTVATVGTDYTLGAAVDLAFDTATTAGKVTAKLRRATGVGTDIAGKVAFDISGPVQFLRKGI